ncbi:hypothetical protein FA09DRAFT_158138 [Tilletiopsis washingtonensis]|uniref:Uncharacterized protein n=1 Tax=Tilletiopsis washingtonensis TaxID=58919 RepID=A0A316Z4B0_9BASI|nr:hypothetical protein FA09DRAFT_158138 [Tilletiopsis washingtonensis]PWN95035.1 hypothetical protein FA09DRAFT_158138 [Tilletiopsis washingtonensis]
MISGSRSGHALPLIASASGRGIATCTPSSTVDAAPRVCVGAARSPHRAAVGVPPRADHASAVSHAAPKEPEPRPACARGVAEPEGQACASSMRSDASRASRDARERGALPRLPARPRRTLREQRGCYARLRCALPRCAAKSGAVCAAARAAEVATPTAAPGRAGRSWVLARCMPKACKRRATWRCARLTLPCAQSCRRLACAVGRRSAVGRVEAHMPVRSLLRRWPSEWRRTALRRLRRGRRSASAAWLTRCTHPDWTADSMAPAPRRPTISTPATAHTAHCMPCLRVSAELRRSDCVLTEEALVWDCRRWAVACPKCVYGSSVVSSDEGATNSIRIVGRAG